MTPFLSAFSKMVTCVFRLFLYKKVTLLDTSFLRITTPFCVYVTYVCELSVSVFEYPWFHSLPPVIVSAL